MVAALRSDGTALEHILVVLLEQPIIETGSDIPPFRACFLAAGVTTATDFVSLTPDAYGAIEFSIHDDGSHAHTKLNVIQIKKLRSLVDWFSQVPNPSATRWFELTEDIFRSWRTQSTLTLPATVPTPSSAPSAISEFRKGVKRSVSDYKTFKEDRFFISWQRHLTIMARSHNVDNVINLTYKATTPDEIALLHEQQKFFFSVLEQTVLTPDGLLIIRKHSGTGDASAAYSDLVERYGKSTAAELAANELENDLIEFRMDASWTKTNLAFLLAWTTKSLDLDAVSAHPIVDSQKRVWFTRAVAPRAVLSLAISQFDTSERLAIRTQGTTYVKANFSVLYNHVLDVATRTDQADKLTQTGNRRANEAKVAAGDNKTPKDNSTFLGKDGERHSFVIPPDQWKAMTPPERIAALTKIRADKGLPPKAVWHRAPPAEARRVNSSNASITDTIETMTSYVEVANPNSGNSVVSGVTQHSSAPPPASSTTTLRQVLMSDTSPASDASTTTPGTDSIVSIGGRF